MTQKALKILAIGGANIDITGFSDEPIKMEDSNPGKLQLCMGGVIRNITENMHRLGLPIKMITAIGDDLYGEKLIKHCQEIGIDISLSLISKHYPSSTYLSIIDTNGDMIVAINNMEILSQLTAEYFQMLKNEIEQSDIILLDTNLNPQSIEYIVKTALGKIFLDTVSTKKAGKIKTFLSYLHTLKTNKIEAEVLSGIQIDSVQTAYKAVNYFLKQGVKQVFISMGKAGVVFGDHNQSGHFLAENIKSINETGAGDAFMAGIAHGFIQQLPLDQIARWASAASILTSESELTNHPDFSIQRLKNKLKQISSC
ncbi:MAG: kinase [Deltaproteobacteria bacterium]|jgi:pseudouridine kinase|nr:kinase [Deltaproteobacteria bacterium]